MSIGNMKQGLRHSVGQTPVGNHEATSPSTVAHWLKSLLFFFASEQLESTQPKYG